MRVKELNWSTVPDHAISIFIGRRKSGKSVNIIDTFYRKRDRYSYGLVFCGSKATIKDYERHFPSSFIYYGYHSDVVGRLIDKQELAVEMGVAKNVFILVDDCMWAKKSILKDPNIRRLFMNGRHSRIFFVLSMQYCMDLHPSLRQQIDLTFLSREKNPQNRERLYKNYNVCFRNAEEFDSCMLQCTQNHETFVLNNGASDSDRPEDNVNWWKSVYAPGGRRCPERVRPGHAYCPSCVRIHGNKRGLHKQQTCSAPFRVNMNGSWWNFHRKRFNPRHFIKDDTVNANAFTVTKVMRKTSGKPEKKPEAPASAKPRPAKKCAATSASAKLMRMRKAMSTTKTESAAKWMSKQRSENIGARKSAFGRIRDTGNDRFV